MYTKTHTARIYIMALTLLLCAAHYTASAQIKDANMGKAINMHSLKGGMKVTVTGQAEDAKFSAVIVTKKDEVLYIEQLVQWDEKCINKKMEVTGVVRIINHTKKEWYTPDGHVTQHMGVGKQFILDKATWKQVP
jgi:hypothetical protein